jgi:outer membrane protein assembly factor BamB
MRYLVSLALVLLLAACGVTEKDYSGATPLMPIKAARSVQPLWAAPSGDVPRNRHAQLPIAVVGDQLYIANAGGDVGRLAVGTGALAWVVTLADKLTGGPGVGGGLVLVGTRKAQLVALAQDSGKELWRRRISSEMLSMPRVAGDLVIVQCVDGQVQALDRKDGKHLWSYSRSTPVLTLRGTSSPLVAGGRVIAGFGDGTVAALDLKTGELQWETTVAVPRGRTDLERMVDIDGLFQTEDGILYVATYQGRIAAVSLQDGSTLWSRDMSSYTGLAVGANVVVVSDAAGLVWALDRRTGATLWRQDKLKGREVSAPAIVDGTVAVADYAGVVEWLSLDDGRFVARLGMDQAWAERQYVWPNDDNVLEDKPPLRSVTTPPVAVAGDGVLVRDNTGALILLALQPAATTATR